MTHNKLRKTKTTKVKTNISLISDSDESSIISFSSLDCARSLQSYNLPNKYDSHTPLSHLPLHRQPLFVKPLPLRPSLPTPDHAFNARIQRIRIDAPLTNHYELTSTSSYSPKKQLETSSPLNLNPKSHLPLVATVNLSKLSSHNHKKRSLEQVNQESTITSPTKRTMTNQEMEVAMTLSNGFW